MRKRVTIADVDIDALTFDEVVAAILAHAAAGGEPEFVVTPNAHHVVLLQKDLRLRAIYERAFLVVPDGVPLLWAARLLGEPLGGRVTTAPTFSSRSAPRPRRAACASFCSAAAREPPRLPRRASSRVIRR